MPSALLTELEQRARSLGFDLFGVVDARRFDASQPHEVRCSRLLPECGTAIVLARGMPTAIDHAGLRELEQLLCAAGVRARVAAPVDCALSFACLGEAAGLGIVSPVIHRLLHPRFGAWVTVQGVLLVQGQPFGPIRDASIAETFHPCCKCPRPCIAACPAGVHDGHGASQLDRCHDHRRNGCTSSCSVVRTCPVGVDQRVDAAGEQERHRFETRLLAARYAPSVWQRLQRWFRA